MDCLKSKKLSMVYFQSANCHSSLIYFQPSRSFNVAFSRTRKKFKRFYDKVTITKCPEKIEKVPKVYTQSKSHVNWSISQSDEYYRINLDKYICKSLLQQPLRIPSYPLAVILAEEWASQPEKPNYIYPRTLRINEMFAKCIKTEEDERVRESCIEEIINFLDTDQLLCQLDLKCESPYKKKLLDDQTNRSNKLIKYMKENYDTDLKMYTLYDKQYGNTEFPELKKELENMDPYVLSCMYTVATTTKSTMLSIALLNDFISIEEAVESGYLEDIYQHKAFGEVQGNHDYDTNRSISDIAACKTIINLCQKDLF